MRHFVRSLLLASGLTAAGFGHTALADIDVVTSIKPVHSLVAGVMKGVGTPHLIVKGAGSPHTYNLKPSDAKALEGAEAVFWVGDEMETFLRSSIDKLARDAVIVELAESHGLTVHKFREGGSWADHEDHDDDHAKAAGDHGSDDHDEEHAKAEDDKREDHDKHDEDHDAGDHAHGETDMHLWLDPQNAKALVAEITETLSKADPGNAPTYRSNGRDLAARLDALTSEIEITLAPVRSKPFVVFHDAFQYMEKRFSLNAVGSITVSPDIQPGAERLREIKQKIGDLGAVCVFAEPQFEPKLIDAVTEGTKASTAALDPLGTGLPDGPDLYFSLMRQNAAALKDCLARSS